MQLSDNEIRDITKRLEEGKPLSDEYRFKLFEEKREVELVWNGKTNEVTSVVLPFQVIEQVDEPRKEADVKLQASLFDFDERGRQIKGWTNKLIWGDNKLILSSLKNGPLRDEIEKEGGIKLIYIDPPFDVGADFSMDIEIGDETLTKKPSVLEELAYRDTWGKGADSWIAMMYERLQLMRDLLADDGRIYVHCDWRVSGYLRLMLDEVFGNTNFRNEIIWQKTLSRKSQSNQFGNMHDTIFFYSKTDTSKIKSIYEKRDARSTEKRFPHIDKETGRRYVLDNFTQEGDGPKRFFGDKIGWLEPPKGKHWIWSQERIDEGLRDSLIKFTSGGIPRVVRFETRGLLAGDIWSSKKLMMHSQSKEDLGYPTQKPQTLIKRIIEASSDEGDLIADFFVGSGTTSESAERLSRKWIGTDLGKFAIHTTRKRIIEVQRQLKKEGKNYRAFEILNLGRYERQHYIGINPNLSSEDQKRQAQKREDDFVELILHAYRAELVNGFKTFFGKRTGRMVSIGPINLPVTRLFVEEVIEECLEKKITEADILAFEFEMGLFPNITDYAKSKGIDLALKYIPPDVFDKRAVEKNQVVFHDVCYMDVKPHVKNDSIAVELTDFSVFYNQDSIAQVESMLKNGGKKIIVENGQIIKVSKDKNGIVTKEVLTNKWTDWIDYWAVDFDFENKKEIVRVLKKNTPIQKKLDGSVDPTQLKFSNYEERWTGDYIFENDWQSFRTKKNRELELKSIFKQVGKGRRKIAVKVVDIFGNDTTKIIEAMV